MKSLILLAIIISGIHFGCSNDIPATDVPSIVTNSFKAKFSNATKTDWGKEKDLFEAEFEIGTNEHGVKITPAGKIIMHKQEISANEFPQALSSTINSDYKKYRLDEADKLEINGKVFYQLEFDNVSRIQKVFNESGVEVNNVPYWD